LPDRTARSFVNQPAVADENGKRAAHRIRERRDGRDGRTRWDLIKRIVRVVHADLRCEEETRRDERQAEGRIERRALAVHERRMAEVDELCRGPEIETADVPAQSGQG